MPQMLVPVRLAGNPTDPLDAAPKQYVDAVSIGYAGVVSGTWAPDGTMARQIKAIVSGALAITSPTGMTDGYYLTLALTSQTATQTITLDGGMGVMAGFPASFQLALGKLALVTVRYSADLARGTVVSVQVEQ